MGRNIFLAWLILGAVCLSSGCRTTGGQHGAQAEETRSGAARIFDAVVDAAGTGDYVSLQAAIDAAPDGRTAPWRIFIQNGIYEELIRIPPNKRFIHLIGQQREGVIICYTVHCGGEHDREWAYSYNNPQNPAYGTYGAVMIVQAPDFYAENLTLLNRFGVERQSGPQALALRSDADRQALYNCSLRSFQDTWRTSTGSMTDRHYVLDCHIEGAVDYIYGAGDVLVENSTLYNVRSGSVIVAPSHNPGTKWGYVFDRCTVDGNAQAADGRQLLGRPWHNSPMALYLNTVMAIPVAPAGWTDMGVIPKRFAEYNSVGRDGRPVDLSHRKSQYRESEREGGRTGASPVEITAQEAAGYTYGNIVGGTDGWDPRRYMERLAAPANLKRKGAKLIWDAAEKAIGYVVLNNGTVVGFTSETEFKIPKNRNEESDRYEIKAIDEFGGPGEAASL